MFGWALEPYYSSFPPGGKSLGKPTLLFYGLLGDLMEPLHHGLHDMERPIGRGPELSISRVRSSDRARLTVRITKLAPQILTPNGPIVQGSFPQNYCPQFQILVSF
jgi:hypothetical protein